MTSSEPGCGACRAPSCTPPAEPFLVTVISVGEVAVIFAEQNEARRFLSRYRTLRLTPQIAYVAALMDRELMDAGGRLGENDNWIAGVCRYYGQPLVSRDRAFDRVRGLRRLPIEVCMRDPAGESSNRPGDYETKGPKGRLQKERLGRPWGAAARTVTAGSVLANVQRFMKCSSSMRLRCWILQLSSWFLSFGGSSVGLMLVHPAERITAWHSLLAGQRTPSNCCRWQLSADDVEIDRQSSLSTIIPRCCFASGIICIGRS